MPASISYRPPVRPRAARNLAIWMLLAGACAIVLAPLFVVDVPPLLDYPNHLARAWVLARLDTDPMIASMFRARWLPIPNLATDLLLPPLIGAMPVHMAGRVMLGVILVLPVLGCIAYARMLFGRITPWSVAASLVTTNGLFLMGFMNFSFSVGCALLAAAGWSALRPRRPMAAAVLGVGLVVALFFSHLIGLMFFLVLTGSREAELCLARDTGDRAWWRRLGRFAAATAPLLVPAAVLYQMTELQSRDVAVGWTPPLDKLRQLALPLVNYDPWLDAVSVVVVAGVLVACLLARGGRMPMSTRLALATLGGLYLALPFALKGTCFLDSRLPVLIGFVLFAGIVPGKLPWRAGQFAALTLVGLLLVRTVEVARVWHGYAEDLAALREVIAGVEPGSNVLLATVSPDEAPEAWALGPRGRTLSNGQRIDQHIPALLVLERRAAWPFFFADPAQQPVELIGRYGEAARMTPKLPDYADIVATFADPASPTGKAAALLACPSCYDYLLLLEAGYRPGFPGLPPDRLEKVAGNSFAALFHVRHPGVIASHGEPRHAEAGPAASRHAEPEGRGALE